VEAANAGNHDPSSDALATRYAGRLGLPATAGSDIHDAAQAGDGDRVFGVYLDKKMETIADYVTAIREKKLAGLRVPAGRCDWSGNETVSLPVDIRNADDRSTGEDLWRLLG
jgi:hypothetical protein